MTEKERDISAKMAALVIDETPDALMAVSLDETILSWNRGAWSMFGYPPEEAIGRQLNDLLAPTVHDVDAREAFRQAVNTGAAFVTTVRKRKSGALCRVSMTLRRVDREGGVSFVAVTERDVTEMRRLEFQQEMLDRFRALIDAAPDALVIVGQEGRIQLINGQAEKLFGYTREELLGQPIEVLVPARYHERHRHLRRNYFDDLSARPMGNGVDLWALRKDQTEFPAEISLAPLATDAGILVTAAIRDLTSRKRAEDKFRRFLEAAPDAIVIVDREGRVVMANAQTETIFGFSRQEIIGEPIEKLIPERFHAAHPGFRAKFSASPAARPMGNGGELVGLRKDGTEFPVEIRLSPLSSEEEELVAAAIRDITERKQLEMRMQEANRLKSEFLANMSHEFRTPLNAIIGFSELMFKGKAGPLAPHHREYLGDILMSSKHLLQLINDILDLAKVESGKMEFRPERVDTARLVGEVRDILRGLAADKRLRIEVTVDPDVASVVVDPARLKQVLYNYLSNAIKFTPTGGEVKVRVGPEGADFFRVDVQDNGIGISEEGLEQLFVEFRQLDGSRAKSHQGTGLGLALTKRIVEARSGRVEVRSRPGEGSTFSAILPREMKAGEGKEEST